MANQQQVLTAANIRYLLVIRELTEGQHGVRSISIARRLGISKPSVTAMLSTLRELGLVEKEKYGIVFLTECGRRKADQYADCVGLLTQRLQNPSGLDETDFQSAACAMLSDTPESELPALLQNLRRKGS